MPLWWCVWAVVQAEAGGVARPQAGAAAPVAGTESATTMISTV
eukprot:SAG31_NODE_22902_length_515_cov_3.889423_1_plen_42_part_10